MVNLQFPGFVTILGTYIEEHGFGKWLIVAGERGLPFEDDHVTHAWLTQDSTIIDTTASQFEDVDEEVVCCSIDSKWHRQFGDLETSPANFWQGDDDAHLPLGPFYRKVCQVLNNNG